VCLCIFGVVCHEEKVKQPWQVPCRGRNIPNGNRNEQKSLCWPKQQLKSVITLVSLHQSRICRQRNLNFSKSGTQIVYDGCLDKMAVSHDMNVLIDAVAVLKLKRKKKLMLNSDLCYGCV